MIEELDCPRCNAQVNPETASHWLGDSKIKQTLNFNCECGFQRELHNYYKS